ncbi:Interleukin-17 receptor C [Merluccius polli]|uniref:Interleukin-17 receptor C n=1 Tax=Merluccius polli TaxID=89951 RepID=A0AA47N7U4_MERPO|nr:Interleukin-17 receptor C [Merluccius polli]
MLVYVFLRGGQFATALLPQQILGELEGGLSNCSVSDDLPMDPPFEDEEDVVDVQGVQARAQLCCRNRQECKLCLAVELWIHVHPQLDLSDGGGGRTNAQTVPRIKTIIDQERSRLELQVGDSTKSLHAVVCLQYERNGSCQVCRPIQPQSLISLGREALIQRNEWKNLSVSLALVERNKALLLWNLSAPCRLDAQVWPCHRGEAVSHHGCKEITGLRKRLPDGSWRQNNKGHWEIPGAFEDFDLLFPCVMVKVNRMEYELGPFCITNAVRGYVVVLSPPDSEEEGVCELVCGLGSFLLEQGLGVSVDQWSHAELCSLGPLPWLYAQLLRVEQLGGGKVVLVLTCGARQKAQEWTRLYGRSQQARTEDRGQGPPPIMTSSFPYADVFSASLSCVAGDRQLGRAGERFLLVDFESCPVQLACRDRHLPDLLEGLSLFRLPSQNQAMLSEILRGGNSQRQTAEDKGAARYIKVKEKTSSPGPETVP